MKRTRAEAKKVLGALRDMNNDTSAPYLSKPDPATLLNVVIQHMDDLEDLLTQGVTFTENETSLLDALAEQVAVIQRLNEHELDAVG